MGKASTKCVKCKNTAIVKVTVLKGAKTISTSALCGKHWIAFITQHLINGYDIAISRIPTKKGDD